MARESSKKKYEYLYHIADAKFRLYGSKSWKRLMKNAAIAMFI